jgi:hypothetical protein
MGLFRLLLLVTPQRKKRRLPRGEDASYQFLQPTCCHENPVNHSTLKLGAFAFPTVRVCFAPFVAFTEVKARYSTRSSDVRYPLPASLTLSGNAVNAAFTSGSCFLRSHFVGVRFLFEH